MDKLSTQAAERLASDLQALTPEQWRDVRASFRAEFVEMLPTMTDDEIDRFASAVEDMPEDTRRLIDGERQRRKDAGSWTR